MAETTLTAADARLAIEKVLAKPEVRQYEPMLISKRLFDGLTRQAAAGGEASKALLRICKVNPLCRP